MTTLMILDDHHLMRDGLKAVLGTYEEFSIIGDTGNVKELKGLLKAQQPDVLIVDMVIDGVLRGYDVIEYVARHYRSVKILAITMLWEKEYADRAFECGALGFLPKRDASQALIEAVRTVASGQKYISSRAGVRRTKKKEGGDTYLEDLSSLTKREKAIFHMIGKGLTNREIAETYGIQSSTVSSHLENVKKKLDISNLKELTQRAVSYQMKYGTN